MVLRLLSCPTPTVSFVVPVYRVEAYLDRCLDSILTDADDGVEVIAVNDASPDRCGDMLAAYARRDPRLRVVHLPTNGGLGNARNVGLSHATGEYVWFVDSDDWLAEGSVAAVRERLRSTRPDVLIVNHAESYPDGRTVVPPWTDVPGSARPPVRLEQRPELLRLAQAAWSKPVRRQFLDQLGLRFRPGWYEDCSYSHPLLMAADTIDLLDRVCYHYRQRPSDRITATVSTRHFEVFDQYQALFTTVEAAGGAYDQFRGELFRLMINHYLVIAGNDARLPAGSRREFFDRIVEDYRRWLPAGGYHLPAGATGLKHRLVRWNAGWAYRALRELHHARSGTRPSSRPATETPSPGLVPQR